MSSHTPRSVRPARSPLASFVGRSGYGLVVAVLLFTALIWLRLRLTTDVPRQAYADPESPREVAQPGRGDAGGSDR